MIAAFVDESGNDDQSHVFSMATILLSCASSYYFGNDWLQLLETYDIKEFHASDFHRCQGEFHQWSPDRCRDVNYAIINLFLKWEVKHSCALVEHDAYQQVFVDTGFRQTLTPAVRKWKKPYFQAFRHTIADLREYADHQPKGIYITPVFDDCQEFMGQAQADYARKTRMENLGECRCRQHANTCNFKLQIFSPGNTASMQNGALGRENEILDLSLKRSRNTCLVQSCGHLSF